MENLKTTITSPTNTERLLEIEIPRDRFKVIYGEKIKKYAKELRLNGFRKGNIPKRLIEERFREPITNETLEKLVDDVIKEVCEEQKITPIAPCNVEDLKNEEDQPILLKTIVEVEQEVTFSNYTNLGVEVGKPEPVTEKFLDEQIENYCRSVAEEKKIEGEGKTGNIVKAEYLQIVLDGKEQPLKENKEFRVEIGLDKIKEYNEAFLGSKSGEEKNITIAYGDDFKIPELAGKNGEYKVKINEICELIIPKADDAFAKKMGSKDLNDFRKTLKKNFEDQRLSELNREAERKAIEKIIENHPFDVPKARVKQYIEAQKKQMGPNAPATQNIDQKRLEQDAVFRLKEHQILEQITNKEKIKATQKEVDAKITELAAQYGMDFDTLKSSLRQSGKTNQLREEIKITKTLDFILGRTS